MNRMRIHRFLERGPGINEALNFLGWLALAGIVAMLLLTPGGLPCR